MYCTISNYSAGGVTRDTLAEFVHLAKKVVTWDIFPISAKGHQCLAALGIIKFNFYFYFF